MFAHTFFDLKLWNPWQSTNRGTKICPNKRKYCVQKSLDPDATALVEDDCFNVAVFIGTDGALNGVFVNAEGREVINGRYDGL
jgi:hypothetical protein